MWLRSRTTDSDHTIAGTTYSHLGDGLLGRWVRNRRWRGIDLSLLLEKQPLAQTWLNLHLQPDLSFCSNLIIQLPTWPPLEVLFLGTTNSVYLDQIFSLMEVNQPYSPEFYSCPVNEGINFVRWHLPVHKRQKSSSLKTLVFFIT